MPFIHNLRRPCNIFLVIFCYYFTICASKSREEWEEVGYKDALNKKKTVYVLTFFKPGRTKKVILSIFAFQKVIYRVALLLKMGKSATKNGKVAPDNKEKDAKSSEDTKR